MKTKLRLKPGGATDKKGYVLEEYFDYRDEDTYTIVCNGFDRRKIGSSTSQLREPNKAAQIHQGRLVRDSVLSGLPGGDV